ncbi:MAG TPA: HD domain-containing protein [Candidatus Bathyarchaeia archaeon]|nr:HD domain-containing protein [Candidatus Bathyarchaeia archaeon]
MDELIGFWEFAARLKAEPRRGWLKKLRLQRPESVADHSFALSILCLFEGERRGYDVEKLLKLALLHDLEEAITGDLTPQDKESKGEKTVTAQKISAREQLLSYFRGEDQRAYRELWAELESENSKEGQLVHELDKLEMALQANEYSRQGIEATKLREFYESSKGAIKDPKLKLVLDQISSKN